jgi:alpha-L-fucosidase
MIYFPFNYSEPIFRDQTANVNKMKIKAIFGFLFFLLTITGCRQVLKNESIPLAPDKNRRPENFHPFKYKSSLIELKENYSEDFMQMAAKQYDMVREVNNRGKWKPNAASIDSHSAPEWFEDAKFGMFIDWGPWAIAGWAPKKKEGAMYPDRYESRIFTDSCFMKYHEKNWGKDFNIDDFIPMFTADNYEPEKLIELASETGMKYVVPFCKHHLGFCLWPSSFTQRDAVDMGPKRDLIKPLVEACRREGLKFGFYFSVAEDYYPLIDSTGQLQNHVWGGKMKPYTPDLERKSSGKIAVRDFAADYIIPMATEFIDYYDPDILWYDGEWLNSAEELHTYDIAAYFYNKAEGRKDVAVNDRYGLQDGKSLRSGRGDFFTSEYNDMGGKAKQLHAWEECKGISQSFGYNWEDTDENVISSKEFIDMFVDIVADGGNLLLIVNLDGKGTLPEIQEKRLKDIGKWLKVNGEGIYSTRPFNLQSDGSVVFTRSKDNRYVYAIMKEWPGKVLNLKGIKADNGSKIEMLGYGNPLEWVNTEGGVTVKLPGKLQKDKNRPCQYAWIVKIIPENTNL